MKSNNLSYNAYLDDVANAIAADDRNRACNCIETVLAENTDCAQAWLIKAWTCESLRETEIALQHALEIDSSNETATAGLGWIRGIQELAELQFEAKREAEEAQRQAEEAARREAEEARQKAEAEAEAARLNAEAEAEAARLQAEAEAQLKAEAEAEEARLQAEAEAEEAQLQEEESSRRQVEEARRWAEEEAQYNAELEKQAEVVRQARTEVSGDTVPADELGQICIDGHDSFDDAEDIETEIKNHVDSLASDIRMEIQSGHGEDETPATASAKKNHLVLAVDDSPTVRKLVSLTLTGDGFEVITACDGVEALNILAERLPDIILSDINMPKLNGYKLCKFVKKHERTKSIPVVMLSGKEGVFDKMRGKMNGCDDYITKPFESADLIKKVRETLAAATSRV